jgi:hypothetical protein
MRTRKKPASLLLPYILIGIVFLLTIVLQGLTLFRTISGFIDTMQFAHKGLAVPLEGVYYGYYMPDLFADQQHPHVAVVPKEHPTLTLLFADWGSESSFPDQDLYRVSTMGIVPIITWEPWDVRNHNPIQPAFSPRLIARGIYDQYIRQFARDAAAYKKPVFIRLAHEMNGNWYPWGAVNGNTPAEYIAMWRHVHDIFMNEKAGNVIWLWSPNNTDIHGLADNVLSYYPGDTYVDWVGFSAFNWGEQNGYHWKSFREIAEPIYSKLEFLDKPVMVAEVSSTNTGGIKEQWFEETLRNGLEFFPNIKGVVFYNANFGLYEFQLSAGMNHETIIRKRIMHSAYFLTTLEFQAR